MAKQRDGAVGAIIKKFATSSQNRIMFENITKELLSEIEKKPKVSGGNLFLSQGLNKILNNSEKTANNLKDDFASTEHILIAIAEESSESSSKILAKRRFTKDVILKTLVSIRRDQRITDQNPEDKYQALEKYGRDLTDLAKRENLTLL
ncbi:MAG: hypothetical protein LBS81_05705 [Endomicrobium sp.]|nr:hypothetical protein [Endomicrobium sp.]